MKFNPSGPKVELALAIKIIDESVYLGRSNYHKDTCWVCHEYQGNFYISLNSDENDVWPADAEDIENYNEQPVTA